MKQIWVKYKRPKDGKYKVVYDNGNGKKVTEIVAMDTLIREQNINGYTVNGLYISPMEWPEIRKD